MSEYRHEYKYFLDPFQQGLLRAKAAAVLLPDPHVDAAGVYHIRSLYFDDEKNTCLRENENGLDDRSKFRIRYYNGDIRRLALEKKSKRRGMTKKESCPLTERQCRQLMAGEYPEAEPQQPPDTQRLLLQMRLRGLQPKVIVSYERAPFIYPAGNVRVTFDGAITASAETQRFLCPAFAQRPILPLGVSLLEVKWDELLPPHIRAALQMERLQWTAFSKYYLCRKYNTNGGLL